MKEGTEAYEEKTDGRENCVSYTGQHRSIYHGISAALDGDEFF